MDRKRDVRGVRSADSTGLWRKRVGVEPTIRLAKSRINGFEGHEDHRAPFASMKEYIEKPTKIRSLNSYAPAR